MEQKTKRNQRKKDEGRESRRNKKGDEKTMRREETRGKGN